MNYKRSYSKAKASWPSKDESSDDSIMEEEDVKLEDLLNALLASQKELLDELQKSKELLSQAAQLLQAFKPSN